MGSGAAPFGGAVGFVFEDDAFGGKLGTDAICLCKAPFFAGFGANVANGFAGAGGGQGIDFATAVQASVDGVDHECAPISSVAGAGGVLCLFKGETVGLLLLRNYADPQAALSVSEEAARAVN